MLLLLSLLTACAGTPMVPAAVPAAPQAERTFDHEHAAFAGVLEGVVTDAGVKYAVLRARKADLDRYVTSLAEVPVLSFDHDGQLAFWVNAYNAITLQLIVDNPGIKSIQELDAGNVWKTRRVQVGGDSLTLDQIEHERARPLSDGRVHAVLNCASKGCPPLPPKPLVGRNIDAQLDGAARRWVDTNAFSVSGNTLSLSPIFKWFPEDFATYRRTAVPRANEAQARGLWFIASFADPNTAGRVTAGAYTIAWAEYDWALNQAE